MKLRYLLISLFSGACITFSSCSADWLNLSPATSVPSDEIKTLEDAQFALNGIYRETSQHSYYGDNYWYYGDCRGTDVQARITGKTRVVPYYTFYVQATDNFNVTLPWNRPYLVIRQANNLIQRIDNHEIESGDAQALNQLKAEALSLRALALFNLTRMFGMPYTNDNGTSLGVPIVLKPEQPDYQPERNTVAECYDQVISDLTTALSLGIGKEKKDGHFNYWGVQALLSRVYLNKGDYKNAYLCATDVIENNGDLYHLYTREEYPEVWGKDFQAESIFELYIDANEPSEWGGGTGGEGAPSVYENRTDNEGWNNLILTQDYLQLINEDSEDIRLCLLEKSKTSRDPGLPIPAQDQPVFLTKFPGKNGDVRNNDICIIRLAEVYLNAAEAGLKEGGAAKDQGLQYLNQLIALRTTNAGQQVAPGDFSVARILKERRKELVGEGLIYFDYLRTQTPIERKGGWHHDLSQYKSNVIVHTDPRVALPVPQSEIDANPGIQ